MTATRVTSAVAADSPRTWDLASVHDEHPLAYVAAPIAATLTGPGFPCPFAPRAYNMGMLELGHVDPLDPDHVAKAAVMISSYLAQVEEIARGNLRRAAFKVLLLDVEVDEPVTAEEACDLAWNFLVELHLYDVRAGHAWPAEIPEDMNDPRWAYCLQETPLFVNMTSSKLEVRRSRNLGRPLVLVIQPTEGLHLIAPLNKAGDRTRESIRVGVDHFDGISRSPFLANAGEAGNSDWSQFWLGDSNSPSPWRPPQVPSVTVEKSA